MVCGTTGESLNMTVGERKALAEAWVTQGRDRFSTIIIHIGAGNIKDSCELAQHAQSIGADAISCISTTFFKPANTDDYVEYMRRVAAAAPDTPFILYDNYNYTGLSLSVNEFFHKARPVMPTLVGTKHTTQNFPSMHRSHLDHHGDGIQIIMGTDEFLLEGLTIGLPTAITNSFLGRVLARVKDAYKKGDMETAAREQANTVRLGDIRRKYGLEVAVGSKYILRTLGLDMGPPRCPLRKLSPAQEDQLRQELQQIDFFSWA